MRPARAVVVKPGHVSVRVVEIGEGAQINPSETGDAEVVVVTVAVERLQILLDVEVGARAAYPLVERNRECACEFLEGRDAGYLLAILIVMFVLGMPEPFILDEISARVAAALLAIERRLWAVKRLEQPYVGCKTLIAEGREAGAVNRIAAAARDDVDRAA